MDFWLSEIDHEKLFMSFATIFVGLVDLDIFHSWKQTGCDILNY